MLERIVISKVRLKILKAFLLTPNSSYHIRGLVRILDEEINAVRRELKNLELFGLITSKQEANKRVYKLNESCIFIQELRSMLLKDTEEIQLITKVLKSFDNIEGVIITKAYMDKAYTNDDDIDILVIGKPNVSKLSKEFNRIEKEIDRELKMAVLSPEDFEFRRKRRERFLLNIIENENIVLIGKFNKVGL